MSTSRQTPLHETYLTAGASMQDVDGWALPRDFGSVADEYDAMRRKAGMFDLSYRCIIDVDGEGSLDWLRLLLANDVGRLAVGETSYGCLCDATGGVLDALIVCRLDERRWRLFGSASARERVLAWLRVGGDAGDGDARDGDQSCEVPRPDTVFVTTRDGDAMLGVQGPIAIERVARVLGTMRENMPEITRLEPSSAIEVDDLFVMRGGPMSEARIEILLPTEVAPSVWHALRDVDVRPCGSEAFEIARIEAGVCRAGVELDASRSPVESGLGATVDLLDGTRAFLGRETIQEQLHFGGCGAMLGLLYDGEGRREMRVGQSVQLAGRDVGTISSATFSPALDRSIALALVERPFRGNCDVLIDAHPFPAVTVALPFVHAIGAD